MLRDQGLTALKKVEEDVYIGENDTGLLKVLLGVDYS